MTVIRKEMNGKELEAVEFLAALCGQMDKRERVLEDRIRAIPNGWRQWKLARSVLDKLLTDIYEGMTEHSLRRVHDMMVHGEVKIGLQPIARAELGYSCFYEKDVLAVINATLRNKCALCIKDGEEIKNCELRKALWEMMPPDEVPKFGCPFANDSHDDSWKNYKE